jgi:nucleotide sugar dehydrogenase
VSNRPIAPTHIPDLLRKRGLKIVVIGLGRIGLPTAALFALSGARVTGVDIRERVVKETNAGRCSFVDEPGLVGLVKDTVGKGNFSATTKPDGAISTADFVIVCVPTPVDETKTPDYSAVRKVADTIGQSLTKGTVVVMESTVGPGIVEDMVGPILEAKSGLRAGRDFGLVSCPERSDPGKIVQNMGSVPRIVGGMTSDSTNLVASLYEAAFGVKTVKLSSPKAANAVKLTENLFRDVNIALANEFALLYEKLGVDVIEVINACASKYNFIPHYPGAGVGGPCLPSNSYYLISEGIKVGNIPYIIRLAREINDRMPDHVVELVGEALNETGKTIKGSRIAVLGVAYKPDVKDLQLTPIERVVLRLKGMGGKVSIYDPMFKEERVFGQKANGSMTEAVKGADCLVIGTAHDEFRGIDLKKVATLAGKRAAIVDSRNIVTPQEARAAGFAYRGVGRALSRGAENH